VTIAEGRVRIRPANIRQSGFAAGGNYITSDRRQREGTAITGYCGSQSGSRQLQNVGAVATTQWACTWTEPTAKAEVTAVCLFEE
jgi:hypothetical protein